MNAVEQPPVEPGLPVEIGRIDKELGKLWEETGDTKTRASLINLAIYTESSEAVSAQYGPDFQNRQPIRLSRTPDLRQPRSSA